MPTDIYGFIEARHPSAAEEWYEGEPWPVSMPLYPLYDGDDHVAFGCLFGVRNWLGWTPVAAGRGLPADVSAHVRTDYEGSVGVDVAMHGCTWVAWSELRDLDMSARPAARGMLQVRSGPGSSTHRIHRYRIDDRWPSEMVEQYGMPPLGGSPVEAPAGRWEAAGATLEYGPVTRLHALGPGTGWEHVFEVMRALAGRFGDDGVRLVVWFD
ncbi:hypothetical protein [Streptosporangium pseudovulgare]|uniref:Uncharacterized protein n=1 Tax=Streptosporangium pseudovulgare TaxID=35765 RepID=A0ABQ2R2Q9_9ACTN|nr:hypothetical protein [Streptosporangium pseudovulgare]GGQ04956.1 hypothetical protein GCM10010140_38910 [Streptosporangium pseudovulgare]